MSESRPPLPTPDEIAAATEALLEDLPTLPFSSSLTAAMAHALWAARVAKMRAEAPKGTPA